MWRLLVNFFSPPTEKSKPKKAVDLFDDDDNDEGDIFSGKFSAAPPAQSTKEAVAEKEKQPEKKVKMISQVLLLLLNDDLVYSTSFIHSSFMFRCLQGPSPCSVLALKACSVRA